MRISDWSSDVCSSDLNRSNPAGTPKWLRSRTRAALRVAMLPAAPAQARYLRHFDASNVELRGPDPGVSGGGDDDEHQIRGEDSEAGRRPPRAQPVEPAAHRRRDARTDRGRRPDAERGRSEEHTSDLQSLMRISYA